jgi:hypothetical protein
MRFAAEIYVRWQKDCGSAPRRWHGSCIVSKHGGNMQRVLITLMLSWMLAGVAVAAPGPVAPDLRFSHPAEAEDVPSWLGELADSLEEAAFEHISVRTVEQASAYVPVRGVGAIRRDRHLGVACDPR